MAHDREPPDELEGSEDPVARAIGEVHRSVVTPDRAPISDVLGVLVQQVRDARREFRIGMGELHRRVDKVDQDLDKVDQKLRGNGEPGIVAEVHAIKANQKRYEQQTTLIGGRLWAIVDRWLIPLLILGAFEALRRGIQG